MTDSAALTIEPLGELGARVAGVAVGALTPGVRDRLREAMAEHGVLVLRSGGAGDAEFVAFMASFGPAVFTDGETPVEGHPDLNVVSNVGRATPPKSVFHIDTSYLENPPAYTALRAVVVPDQGGETVFADTFAAYDALDEDTRTTLAEASVTHEATGIPSAPGSQSRAEHPLFLRHPVNGRRAVYLSNPPRLTAVSGLDPAEAKATIDRLYDHATRPPHPLRHAWSQGDIVVWDNRRTLHRADHEGVAGDRVLHRAMNQDAVAGRG